jgi:hypothetical protein
MKIQIDYIIEAIKTLRPNAEFSFNEEDYSSIKYDKLDGQPPTDAEIDAMITEIKNKEAEKLADKATNKAALLAKLGITADEARLLLS